MGGNVPQNFFFLVQQTFLLRSLKTAVLKNVTSSMAKIAFSRCHRRRKPFIYQSDTHKRRKKSVSRKEVSFFLKIGSVTLNRFLNIIWIKSNIKIWHWQNWLYPQKYHSKVEIDFLNSRTFKVLIVKEEILRRQHVGLAEGGRHVKGLIWDTKLFMF